MLATIKKIQSNIKNHDDKKAHVIEYVDESKQKWLVVFHIEKDIEIIDIEFLGMDGITDLTSYAVIEFSDMCNHSVAEIENDILIQVTKNVFKCA